MTRIKISLVLGLIVLVLPLHAQDILRTFVSPDGSFQFQYSGKLVDCLPVVRQQRQVDSSVIMHLTKIQFWVNLELSLRSSRRESSLRNQRVPNR
jgi:hypothetical protein